MKLTQIPPPGSANTSATPTPHLPDPVFHDPRHHIKIFQGDCLDILAAIPEATVDLIFADPPYFLSNDGITCHAGRMVSVNKGQWDRSRGVEDNHKFNLAWLQACQRLLKPDGAIWVSGTAHVIHSVGFAMQQLGFKLLNDISWVKPNPPPNLSCRYFTHATETLIWAAKNKKSRHTFHYKLMKQHAGGKQMKSVWQFYPPDKSEKRFGKHPTQKPVALLERILLASSDPKAIVLDPFLGSGTTAIAAIRLRRSFCGIEISAQFVAIALQRIGNELIAVVFAAEWLQISSDKPPIRGSSLQISGNNLTSCHSEGASCFATDTSQSSDRRISGVLRARRTHPASLRQIALDLAADPMDRSLQARRAQASKPQSVVTGNGTSRLVHHEKKFFFVGSHERAVVFSTIADSLDDAWRSFHSSSRSHIPIFSVIKTETEIHLATGT